MMISIGEKCISLSQIPSEIRDNQISISIKISILASLLFSFPLNNIIHSCRTRGTWDSEVKNLQMYAEIQKNFFLDVYHFQLDLINNMDHMRISGTDPSSVIQLRKEEQKICNDAKKV